MIYIWIFFYFKCLSYIIFSSFACFTYFWADAILTSASSFIERFENNLSRGMSPDEAEKEALKHTSEEMGHHREEITKHYLG